jgi:hypothetical protein
MADCALCGVDTNLFYHGVSVCVTCSADVDAGAKSLPREDPASTVNQDP